MQSRYCEKTANIVARQLSQLNDLRRTFAPNKNQGCVTIIDDLFRFYKLFTRNISIWKRCSRAKAGLPGSAKRAQQGGKRRIAGRAQSRPARRCPARVRRSVSKPMWPPASCRRRAISRRCRWSSAGLHRRCLPPAGSSTTRLRKNAPSCRRPSVPCARCGRAHGRCL